MSEQLEHLFDYGSINDDHKAAAKEIAELADQMGNSMLSELIKTRFQLKTIPKYPLEESIFVKECLKADVKVVTQGYVRVGTEPDIVQYPLLAICEDVRNLDKLVISIRNSN